MLVELKAILESTDIYPFIKMKKIKRRIKEDENTGSNVSRIKGHVGTGSLDAYICTGHICHLTFYHQYHAR